MIENGIGGKLCGRRAVNQNLVFVRRRSRRNKVIDGGRIGNER